jgi:transposase, IS5 family
VGVTPEGASRRVSLHDPNARPIAKGRVGKPVEFGYKGPSRRRRRRRGRSRPQRATRQLVRRPQLAPAIERVIRRTGRRPRTVTADRRHGEQSVQDALHDLGIRTVVIARKGKPSKARQATEHRRSFRRTVKWRTGSEGPISCLKRQYGWDCTRLDATQGARIWRGHGILTHNLVKIAALPS